MIPAPIANNETERLEALYRYDILDTETEVAFDDLTQLAAQICEVPIALVSLIDSGRQWFKSRVGLDACETPRDISFCGHAIQGRDIFEVQNACDDPRFHDNPLVIGAPGIRFYAGVPLTVSDGQNLGTLCVIDQVPRQLTAEQRDALGRLTRQVVAQLELRLSNRRLSQQIAFQRAILESAEAAIVTTTKEGVITQVNPAAERMLSYPAGAMVGNMTLAAFHDCGELAARAKALGGDAVAGVEVLLAQARGGTSVTREWTYVRRDGSHFPVLLSVSPLGDGGGATLGFLAIARDLTQQKAAALAYARERDRLDMALASARLASWEIDVNRRQIRLDERWALLLGGEATTRELPVDELLNLVPGDSRTRLRDALDDVLTGRKDGLQVEYQLESIGKELRWIRGCGKVAERDQQGRIVRLIGVCSDITESRAAEAALREARNAAEAANRAKSAFLANMSHEIRTPLSAIIGTVELLEETRAPDEQARLLRVTLSSATALTGIIDDVLDLSKIEAGMLDVHTEPMSLRETVSRTVEVFAGNADAKKLCLRQCWDERLPDRVYCDPVRFRQILFNLLSNAIKFTDTGDIEIRARFEGCTPAGVTISIDVADTGIGIAPEAQARLFQPFMQAEDDTNRRFGGTGLGLAISRRLATLLGGDLSLQSQPGRGTTMTLSLELALAQTPDGSDPICNVAGPEAAVPGSLDGCRLLLVDDSAVNRMVIGEQLKRLGCRVEQARSGQEAFELWRSGDYDLVLTDCHMPNMDGYALARRIRENEVGQPRQNAIPILGCTANALQKAHERCLQVGMNDVLVKPVPLQKLETKLRYWLSPGRAQYSSEDVRQHRVAGTPPEPLSD